MGFWASLESYTWKVIGRVAPTLPYFGIGLMVSVMGASLLSAKTSVAGAYDLREASVRAARAGDYTTAQSLYNLHKSLIPNSQNVLGAESEVEDLIFPKRVVEREIQKYEVLLQEYPGHRDIYLVLAKLYAQIEISEESQKYYELARELDPNNATLKSQITNSLPAQTGQIYK